MTVQYDQTIDIGLIDIADETYQPRLGYSEEKLAELAEAIKEIGQRNSIGIEPVGDRYRVVYGYHRTKALLRLEATTVRADVYTDVPVDMLHYHSLSDNIQHLDLSGLEKALRACKLRSLGWSIEQLSKAFSVGKSGIYDLLTVEKLDTLTMDALAAGVISLYHAVELAKIPDVSERSEILLRTILHRASVKDMKIAIHHGVYPIVQLPPDAPYYIRHCPVQRQPVSLAACHDCEYGKVIQHDLVSVEEALEDMDDAGEVLKYTAALEEEYHKHLRLHTPTILCTRPTGYSVELLVALWEYLREIQLGTKPRLNVEVF